MAITKPDLLTPWADAGDKTTPSGGLLSSGFVTPARPGRRLFNWLFNFLMNAVRYFMRRGITSFDNTETYAQGDVVQSEYSTVLGAPAGGATVVRGGLYRARAPAAGVPPWTASSGWEALPPSTVAPAGDSERDIVTFLNTQHNRRFQIDHLGFPAGQILQWEENFDRWPPTTFLATAAGDPLVIIGTHVVVRPAYYGAAPASTRHGRVTIEPPTGSLTAEAFYHYGSITPNTDDVDISLRWKGGINIAGVNKTRILMGLAVNGASTLAAPGYGAWFSKLSTDTNWFCKTNGLAGVTSVDSGIAAQITTFEDFKIEIVGSAADASGVGRAIFYIGDTIVAIIPVVVSTMRNGSTEPLCATFCAETTTTGGTQFVLSIARVQYRHGVESRQMY